MATNPEVVVEKLDIAWDLVRKWPAPTLGDKLDNFKRAYKAVSEAVDDNDGDTDDGDTD